MRLTLLIAAAACGCGPLLLADEEITFNQRYKPNHDYHQTLTTQQEIVMELGGKQSVKQETSTTMGMQLAVTPREDGRSKCVAVKYDSVKAELKMQGQTFTYDSKSPENSDAGQLQMYANIIGQEFRVIFDEDEKVTDVENAEATVERLAGANPAGSQTYKQMFNKEAFKRMMEESSLRSPPGRPVKIGGAWPFTQELPLQGLGKLTIQGFYTFKGMVKHKGVMCAEVKAAAEIKLDTAANTGGDRDTLTRGQEMDLKIENGQMEGTIYYDPAIDFTREVSIAHHIVLTGKTPEGSGGSRLRMPMKQTLSMVLDSFERKK